MPERSRTSVRALRLSVVLAAGAALGQDRPSGTPSAPVVPAVATPSLSDPSSGATADPPTGEAHPSVTVSEEVVDGLAVHRGRGETIIHAPMELVVRRMMDFGRYPDFMPHVEESRVVHRNHALTDLYIRVPLTPALGSIWSLLRIETHRTPDRVEMVGNSVDGNMDHFETRTVIERVPGPEPLTRFSFAVLAQPRLPFPAVVFTHENCDAARTVVTGLRGLVERSYALNGIQPANPPAVPPEAASQR